MRVTLSYMEADPRTAVAFEWDSRNVDKLAKRQIRPEDVGRSLTIGVRGPTNQTASSAP